MISELHINSVVLPLEDDRYIIYDINPFRTRWIEEKQGDKLILHDGGGRHATPREMLFSMKVARRNIDRAVLRL